MNSNILSREFNRLRSILIITIAVLLIFVISLSIWDCYNNFQRVIETTEIQSKSYARALKEHAERVFSEADKALQNTIIKINASGGIDKYSRKELTGLTNNIGTNSEYIGSLSIIGANGKMLALADDLKTHLPDVSERNYFKFHRDNLSITPHVGPPVKSLISNTYRFTLSQRINNSSGSFAGIVVVTFNVNYLEKLYEEIVSGVNGRVSLVSLDGDYLVFIPSDERVYSGSKKTAGFFRKRVAQIPADTYHNPSSNIASEYRIVSYNRLANYPVVAIVSFGKDKAMEGWRQSTIIRVIVLLGLCGIATIMSYFLLRGLRERETSNCIMAEQQAELINSENKLRVLFESSSAGIITTSPDGAISNANGRMTEMLGYSVEELIGTNILAYLHLDQRGTGENLMRQLLNKETDQIAYELNFIRKDGTEFWGFLSGRRYEDTNGTPISLIGNITDISELKNSTEKRITLEKHLLHAQKLESLGVMAGGIAHDFNNLLQSILGNMELALLKLDADSESKKNISKAINSAMRAAHLTNLMLTYAGKGFVIKKDLNLNDLVRENVEMLKTAASTSVSLELSLSAELPCIIAGEAQIQQVVMNLITNAAESIIGQQGHITITTGVLDCDQDYLSASLLDVKPDPGRYVYLEVKDNGCGMSEETIKRLFDPFFTTKFAGRGLGMSAVMGIVKSHRGTLFVNSKPGAGTTFRVLFPVSETALPAQVKESIAPPVKTCTSLESTLSGVALVVDDEKSVLRTCAKMARLIGFNVITANDGIDAVAKYREHADEIDVVLMDLTMPNMDGLTAMGEIYRISPDIKVILASGFNEEELNERLTSKPPSGFIRKPYSIKTLETEFRRVMQENRQ